MGREEDGPVCCAALSQRMLFEWDDLLRRLGAKTKNSLVITESHNELISNHCPSLRKQVSPWSYAGATPSAVFERYAYADKHISLSLISVSCCDFFSSLFPPFFLSAWFLSQGRMLQAEGDLDIVVCTPEELWFAGGTLQPGYDAGTHHSTKHICKKDRNWHDQE